MESNDVLKMDKELEEIKRKRMREIMRMLNKNKDKPVLVRIFDVLLPASGCGPSGCGPGGCGPSFTSPNMLELQELAFKLIQKYGRDKFKFELFNILDSSIQKFPDVYKILKEKKGDAVPIISINGNIKFIGRVPSFEEFEKKIEVMM